MRQSDQLSNFAVTLHHAHATDVCRYCGHAILLCDEVGWIDTVVPYLGGTYDMCTETRSGAHEPVDDRHPRVVARWDGPGQAPSAL